MLPSAHFSGIHEGWNVGFRLFHCYTEGWLEIYESCKGAMSNNRLKFSHGKQEVNNFIFSEVFNNRLLLYVRV